MKLHLFSKMCTLTPSLLEEHCRITSCNALQAKQSKKYQDSLKFVASLNDFLVQKCLFNNLANQRKKIKDPKKKKPTNMGSENVFIVFTSAP